MLHTSESYGYNSFTKITIKSMWQVVKSNTIVTNYFITFLQIIDMINFLLVFTSPPLGKCHQSPSSDVPSITGKCQTRWKKLSGPNILCGSGSAINHHPVKCHQSQGSVKHGGKIMWKWKCHQSQSKHPSWNVKLLISLTKSPLIFF